MKQFLLTFSFLAVFVATAAQTPEAKWAALIDGSTSAGDQATDVTVDSQGNVYWYGVYGTTSAARDVYYIGEFLFEGAASTGVSQNNNYTLLKTDPDGHRLWCVYSSCGDFASGAGFCAATSDGGVVTVAKVRHTDGLLDQYINFVDASGNSYPIEWTTERRCYRLAVTKISAYGEIEWIRMIDFLTAPGEQMHAVTSDFLPDVFTVAGGALDDNDNIYIALNYRNSMSIPLSQGESVTLVPSNVQSWTGDTQTGCGDFLLLGLDHNGYYRNNLRLQGECTASYCQKLVWDAGRLYAQGYIIGKDRETLTAGTEVLSPSDVISPVLLCADSNLNVKWAKCFPGEAVDGKNALQNVGLSVGNGAVYMCGQYNLKFSDPDDPSLYVASTQGTIREGFILKIDAADGSWLAARDSRSDDWDKPSVVAKTGLTGYLSVILDAAHPDDILTFGYVMNANVGVFLREYDAHTLQARLPGGQYNIVTGGGVPSAQCVAYDSAAGALYFNARGNNVFNLLGDISTPKPSGWGVLAGRIDLKEDMFSGMESVAEDADTDLPIEYYNLQGMRVSPSTSGFYIRRQGSKVTKMAF